MKRHLIALALIFSFFTLAAQSESMILDTPDIDENLNQQINIDDFKDDIPLPLSDLVSATKKEKESLERELAQDAEDFEEDTNEPFVRENFKKSVDLGDVEVRISHRKKEAYVEIISLNKDDSLEITSAERILATTKKSKKLGKRKKKSKKQ